MSQECGILCICGIISYHNRPAGLEAMVELVNGQPIIIPHADELVGSLSPCVPQKGRDEQVDAT